MLSGIASHFAMQNDPLCDSKWHIHRRCVRIKINRMKIGLNSSIITQMAMDKKSCSFACLLPTCSIAIPFSYQKSHFTFSDSLISGSFSLFTSLHKHGRQFRRSWKNFWYLAACSWPEQSLGQSRNCSSLSCYCNCTTFLLLTVNSSNLTINL